MIVHLNNGGVLELFRLYRGAHAWTRPMARTFLLRYRRDGQSLAELRRLLADRRPTLSIVRASDEAVIERVAYLISIGEIVVVQERASYRWGGARAPLGGARDGVLLVWRDGMNGVHDATAALACLPAINTTRSPIQSLRHLFANTALDTDDWVIEDKAILQKVETAMQSGEIVAAYHWPHGTTEEVGGSPQTEAPPAERTPPARDDTPESNTFPADHSGATQASGLRGAARDGVPFCEVCQRAAASRAS